MYIQKVFASSFFLLVVLGILGILVGLETPVLDEWRAEYPIIFLGILPKLPMPLLFLTIVSGIVLLVISMSKTK